MNGAGGQCEGDWNRPMGRNENTNTQFLSPTSEANAFLGEKWPGRFWTSTQVPIPSAAFPQQYSHCISKGHCNSEGQFSCDGSRLVTGLCSPSSTLPLLEDDSDSWGGTRVKGENACRVPRRVRML